MVLFRKYNDIHLWYLCNTQCLHIKLGLMKNFVKVPKRGGCGFQYLKMKFGAQKSDAKLEAGILIGLEMRKSMAASKFIGELNPLEWKA